MPISQLVRKLSNKLDSKNQQRSSSTSFEVVAEVMQRPPGSTGPGALCSSASQEGGVTRASASFSHSLQHQTSSVDAHARPQDGAPLSASLSGPLPSMAMSSSLPATTSRAMRARSKALERTQSGMQASTSSCGVTMEHAHSLDSSGSSMDIAGNLPAGLPLAPSGPGGLSLGLASPRRLSAGSGPLFSTASRSLQPPVAPAPAAAAGGCFDASVAPQPLASSVSAPAPTALGPVQVLLPMQQQQHGLPTDECDYLADDDDCLVAPMSPGGAAAGADDDADDEDAHCHWEDGVVATWLQAIDHSELLHDGDDEDDHTDEGDAINSADAIHTKQQQVPAAAPGSCSTARPAAGGASIYSSLLYN